LCGGRGKKKKSVRWRTHREDGGQSTQDTKKKKNEEKNIRKTASRGGLFFYGGKNSLVKPTPRLKYELSSVQGGKEIVEGENATQDLRRKNFRVRVRLLLSGRGSPVREVINLIPRGEKGTGRTGGKGPTTREKGFRARMLAVKRGGQIRLNAWEKGEKEETLTVAVLCHRHGCRREKARDFASRRAGSDWNTKTASRCDNYS